MRNDRRFVSRSEEAAILRAQLEARRRRQAAHRQRMGQEKILGLGALGVISDHAPLLTMAAIFVGVPVAINYLGRRAAERDMGSVR